MTAVRTADREHERGGDRPALEQLDPVILARPVDEPPVADERRRAAAVEVQRAARAEPDAARRASSPSVSPASSSWRPSQATASRWVGGERERAARVAAVGDVGVELVRARGEALVVAAGQRARAVAHEQRAGLEQVAGRRGRQVGPAGDRDAVRAGVHARAQRVPRRVERHVVDRLAGDPQLAERRVAAAARRTRRRARARRRCAGTSARATRTAAAARRARGRRRAGSRRRRPWWTPVRQSRTHRLHRGDRVRGPERCAGRAGSSLPRRQLGSLAVGA